MPITALPKLVWVGSALFVTNLLVGIGMLITPSLDTDPYGREVQAYDSTSSKISPFMRTVDSTKHKVRLAAKAVPVTFVPAPVEEETSAYTNASLDLPRSSAKANELDIPRTSRGYQQLDLPVRTENALYRPADRSASPNTLKVSSGADSYNLPRSSERAIRSNKADMTVLPEAQKEKNFVVIN
jgi:hypothetical protein